MNFELMEKLKKAIRQSKSFDMSVVNSGYEQGRGCLSPGCVAGHIMSLCDIKDDDPRIASTILIDELGITEREGGIIYHGSFSKKKDIEKITKTETLAHLEWLEAKYRKQEQDDG